MYYWSKGDIILIGKKNVITFERISKEHEGEYTCHGSNKDKSTFSGKSIVLVEGKRFHDFENATIITCKCIRFSSSCKQ